MRLLTPFGSVCLLFAFVQAHKLLVINPMVCYSAANFQGKLADVLSSAGHDVTLLNIILDDSFLHRKLVSVTKDVRWIPQAPAVKATFEKMIEVTSSNDMWTMDETAADSCEVIEYLVEMGRHAYAVVLQNETFLNEMRREKYDVVFAEPVFVTSIFIAELIGAKSVLGTNTFNNFDTFSYAAGEPVAPSYVPAMTSPFSDRMSLFQRMRNFYESYLMHTFWSASLKKEHATLKKSYPHIPDNYEDIIARVSYMFTNSNPYLDFPHPMLHKTVKIGGITVDKGLKEPLPKKFDEILNLRPKTVLISFGSICESSSMPATYKATLLSVFAAFPDVTFIWKYEDETDTFTEHLKNVILVKWMPQAAILSDKRLTAFVSHGGLGSCIEMAHFGKPALLIPVFADHARNGNMLVRQGTATMITKHDLNNVETVKAALLKVLTDETYTKNAIRLSEMLLNQPFEAKEWLLRHTEFAARFGHIDNLDPYGRKLSLIQYYFIDAALVLLTVAVIGFYVIYKTLAFLLKCFRKSKSKSD